MTKQMSMRTGTKMSCMLGMQRKITHRILPGSTLETKIGRPGVVTEVPVELIQDLFARCHSGFSRRIACWRHQTRATVE
jgi:hypothetical protein